MSVGELQSKTDLAQLACRVQSRHKRGVEGTVLRPAKDWEGTKQQLRGAVQTFAVIPWRLTR